MNSSNLLDTANHSRDSAGMTYVYPVVSRRAGGVSIGINLNPNNACNWRCIYCQVPDLVRGPAPEIDLDKLARELRQVLDQIVNGDFMQQRVGEQARHLEDIAFSGNGEPTSSSVFPQAVAIVEEVLGEFGLLRQIKIRLITNGSLIDRPYVIEGLKRLARCDGEVWFKLDAATAEGIARINDVHLKPEPVLERLLLSASLCPTWVQSCLFTLDGEPPAEPEIAAYVELLAKAASHLSGVHLYGLARPSMQAEAPRLGRLPESWLQALATRLRDLGLTVKVSP